MNLELYRSFQCFPRLPSEIRAMIWNHAMIFWSEPQVICVKMESSKPGVLIPTGRTAVQCPLLQVNQESRTETLNVVQPYIYNNYGIPVVYINSRLDIILLDDYKSFDQFCKRAERPGWREIVVPHIALFHATWKRLYNYFTYDKHGDVVEGEGFNFKILDCMACIWPLGVRDLTILVSGEDTCHRSTVKFETPKKGPLESSITKNELFEDWESLEQIIAENIKDYQDMRIEDLAKYREGMS